MADLLLMIFNRNKKASGENNKYKKFVQSRKLSDLDLRIGQTVQLITQGLQSRKYDTRLVGHVDQEFAMLRVAVENGWAVTLEEGQSLGVRAFCGVALYELQILLLVNALLRPQFWRV